jgi:hypothetical protein
VALALLWAGGAWARARFVVLPFAAGRGVSAEEAERFTRALQAQLGLESLLWVPPAPKAHESPVHAAFARAHRLYRARRFSSAKQGLQRAFVELEKDPEAFEPEEVASAHVLLGAIELRAGSKRRCRQALEDALRLDPGYRPPRGAYPRIFDRELSRARAALRRSTRFPLRIDGPDGAEVLLDGQRLGILPGVRARAVAGTHHLRLKGANGEVHSEWVRVKGPTRLPVLFPPVPEQAALPVLSESVVTPAWAASLAQALAARQADLAALGVLSRTADGGLEASAAVFQQRGAALTPVKPVQFDASFHSADAEALVLSARLSQAADAAQPPVALPYDLSPAPSPVPPSAAALSTASRTPVGPAGAVPTAPRTAPPARLDPVPSATPPPTLASRLSPAPAGQVEEDSGSGSFLSGVPAWVWIVGGVGVAAGAGATYWAIHQRGQPVTGTVEATW